MIIKAFHEVMGWTKLDELVFICECIHTIVENKISGYIVEIGTAQGKATIQIAEECKMFNKDFIAIDDFSNSPKQKPNNKEILMENLEKFKVKDIVCFLNQSTNNVDWEFPIALLFHDGAHDSKQVLKDMEMFWSQVQKGGMVLFHDYTRHASEVAKAIEEFGLGELESYNTIGYITK